MDLGLSVVIFLAIAIFVMLLFCLVTRYFNKKLERALLDDNEVYSMIEEIRGKDENEEVDGEYENYVNRKESLPEAKDRKKDQVFELEMTEVREPLRGLDQDIYGMSSLKRRLEGSAPPKTVNPESNRSVNSLKSFRPQRIGSDRNNLTSNRSQVNSGEDLSTESDRASTRKLKKDKGKDSNNVTVHSYVSKIVSYTADMGIFVIENKVSSVQKKQKIEEKRAVQKKIVASSDTAFDQLLQVYGFELNSYCAFKFQTRLEIPHMKPNEQYQISSLKATQSKAEIQFAQFYILKDQLLQGA